VILYNCEKVAISESRDENPGFGLLEAQYRKEFVKVRKQRKKAGRN